MKEITKHYTNGDITVVWQPHVCIHSAICFRGLPAVFDPRERPWVRMEGASTEEIIAQIGKCPSGALSVKTNKTHMENQENKSGELLKIQVMPKGPLIVKGTCTVVDESGNEITKENQVALCRCGASSNKPYCDGSHRQTNVL